MQKRRAALTEELVKESSVDVPHILIERELDSSHGAIRFRHLPHGTAV